MNPFRFLTSNDLDVQYLAQPPALLGFTVYRIKRNIVYLINISLAMLADGLNITIMVAIYQFADIQKPLFVPIACFRFIGMCIFYLPKLPRWLLPVIGVPANSSHFFIIHNAPPRNNNKKSLRKTNSQTRSGVDL
ncbi:hypothetical protein D3C87_1566940 [compost metagenome]